MTLAMTYNLPFIAAALVGGMKAVAALPQWEDTFAANPGNRDRVHGQGRATVRPRRWPRGHRAAGNERLVPRPRRP